MELDGEVEKLHDIMQTVYKWRHENYINPIVQPAADRLSEAIECIKKAKELLDDPMGK